MSQNPAPIIRKREDIVLIFLGEELGLKYNKQFKSNKIADKYINYIFDLYESSLQ